jgi:predicted TIM-barrel fold metal-dependent hydrolase
MLFEPVIRNYPDIQFVLFHAGYPWYTQIAGLAHNYPNVVIDMVWAPIISTSASIQALKEYIEVAPSSDLIGWGGDTWTSEEAVGAVLAWKYVIAKVLAEMIESGYLSTKKAEILAEKLLYKNNAGIYGIAAP